MTMRMLRAPRTVIRQVGTQTGGAQSCCVTASSRPSRMVGARPEGLVCEARDRAVWREFVSALDALSFDEMLAERNRAHEGHDASS